MEVNLLDKLLYRPVVNTVYMKPNRRLGRIIGINGNLIFCIEQDFSIISVKTSAQFIRNCSVGTYKISNMLMILENGQDRYLAVVIN